MNDFNISGRIISDLQLNRTKQKDIAVINFRIVHKSPKLRNPVYIDVELWDKAAEDFAEEAFRGSFVMVYGSVRRDVWTTQDNEFRSKLKINARKVVVDNSKKKDLEEASF